MSLTGEIAFDGLDIWGLIIQIILLVVMATGVSYILTLYFAKNIFQKILEHNLELSKYNKHLAHELKTPISIIYGNLEILEHEYIPEKIHDSQVRLKEMICIIDGLLNYSESLKISEKKYINLENFIRKNINFYNSSKIRIHNKEFNMSVYTDEILFSRIISNIIENAQKYSLDTSLDIYISQTDLRFENPIAQTLSEKELLKLSESAYGKSFEEKRGHQIGLPMIAEISKALWYKLEISSEDNKFIVAIVLKQEEK